MYLEEALDVRADVFGNPVGQVVSWVLIWIVVWVCVIMTPPSPMQHYGYSSWVLYLLVTWMFIALLMGVLGFLNTWYFSSCTGATTTTFFTDADTGADGIPQDVDVESIIEKKPPIVRFFMEAIPEYNFTTSKFTLGFVPMQRFQAVSTRNAVLMGGILLRMSGGSQRCSCFCRQIRPKS